jgi:hypothetical protein
LLSKSHIYTVFRILVLFIPALVAPDIKAQISSPEADAVRIVSYPVDTVDGSAFIFYSPPGTTVKGSLTASLIEDSSYNFDWFRYNTATGDFDIPMLSESGLIQSVLDNIDEGGYLVRINNGTTIDTSFISWVHIDKLVTSIVKDAEGKVFKSAYTCDFLTLSGAVSIDTFYYYDPMNNDKVRLKNGFTFEWTSDNAELKIPNSKRILDPNTTYSPPYLDTWYILTAIDSFGMSDVDSVLYKSIQVKSEFSYKIYDPKIDPERLDTAGFIPDMPDADRDAPLLVKFDGSASTNGYKFEWIFADSARSGFFKNEFASDSAYQPQFLYKIPGDYYPAIVVTSEAECTDTFKLTEPITVVPSELKAANVFSPDGVGENNLFKPSFKSIKEFNIRIYNRTGDLVYKAEVTDMYKWAGWDGMVLDNSNKPASPGIYYYVIEATGWDRKSYQGHKGTDKYAGFVYLFRKEQ